MPRLKLLLLSTPVGPLGSGLGGGVELTLANLAKALVQQGHQVTIVAPQGSECPSFPLVELPGELQITAQSQDWQTPINLPADSVLANMWQYARQVQFEYDMLLNFAYDWLPFYLTPFFHRPICHLVSMGSLSAAMDRAIGQVIHLFPGTIAVHSLAQAATFPFGDRCYCVSNGFDLSPYQFQPVAQQELAWIGRIAPEKGLEDAVAAAQMVGIPLRIMGVVQDEAYWQWVQQCYTEAPIDYVGFLPTRELQAKLGQAKALLMTPHWVEAFGNVAIEALACGVPVIAYRRGGPAEIVHHGKTGWLVEPGSVAGLVDAIHKIDQIDRQHCRQQAETDYSLTAWGKRVEIWLQQILSRSGCETSKEG